MHLEITNIIYFILLAKVSGLSASEGRLVGVESETWLDRFAKVKVNGSDRLTSLACWQHERSQSG